MSNSGWSIRIRHSTYGVEVLEIVALFLVFAGGARIMTRGRA